MPPNGQADREAATPMEDTAVTVYEAARPVAALMTWTQNDLDALKATVAKGCDESQFKVFIMAARRLGLDPFARQIVPITQGGGMTPQVTIDGLRLIAERTGKYGGQIGPQWCGKDGVWHDVWLEDGAPAAARVAVIRRDFEQPMWGVARYKSYAKGGNWTGMPDVMIAKVAESLALRKAFPQELSGVYSDDEMGGDNNTPTPPATTTQPARHDPAAYTARTIEQGKEMTAKMAKGQAVETLSYRQAVAKAGTSEFGEIDTDETLPSWAAIRKLMLGAGVRTMADANALTLDACGQPWEKLTEIDFAAKRKMLAKVNAMLAAKHSAQAKVVDAAEPVDLADLPPVAMVP